MKKLVLAVAMMVLIPTLVLAAGSACTSSKESLLDGAIKTITWSCTGDDGTGAFPATAATTEEVNFIKGYYLYQIEVNPGATGPEDGVWDITIPNTAGFDLAGAKLTNLSATVTKRYTVADTATEVGLNVVTSGFILTPVQGASAVNSATFTAELIFIRPMGAR